MLGIKRSLKWTMDGDSNLIIQLPASLQKADQRPCKQAFTFKIEGDFNPAAADK
jgi:hypothetical protein